MNELQAAIRRELAAYLTVRKAGMIYRGQAEEKTYV